MNPINYTTQDSIILGVHDVVINVIIGVILVLFGVYIYLKWQKKVEIRLERIENRRVESCNKLNKKIHDHNEKLINQVFKEWVKIGNAKFHENAPINYHTSLETINFDQYKIGNFETLKFDLKDLDKAIDHSKGYVYLHDLWAESVSKTSNRLIETTTKIWNNIEQKLLLNPSISKFTDCEDMGVIDLSSNCYHLKNTVWLIYQEAEFHLKYNIPWGVLNKNKIQNYYQINSNFPAARTVREDLADEFINAGNEIAVSYEIIELLKQRKEDEKHLDINIQKFKNELQNMIDKLDSTEELKGVCDDCRGLHEELDRLSNID